MLGNSNHRLKPVAEPTGCVITGGPLLVGVCTVAPLLGLCFLFLLLVALAQVEVPREFDPRAVGFRTELLDGALVAIAAFPCLRQ